MKFDGKKVVFKTTGEPGKHGDALALQAGDTNWKQLFIFTILVNIDQDKLIRIVL